MRFPKHSILIAAATGLATLSACAEERNELAAAESGQNTLTVYLSRTGNTGAVARMIHRMVGGDIVDIELETPYPDDYQTIVAQVDRENDTGYLPPLKTRITNIRDYDTVFMGFPTWDMQLPPPMKSFLEQYDLSGITVAPFNTNAGYGVGSSFDYIEQHCQGCNVVEGFSVKGGIERDGIMLTIQGDREEEVQSQISEWLDGLQIQ